MPTLRKWNGCSQSQMHPGRVRWKHAGMCVKTGLRSLTRNANGGDTDGRLRCGAETACDRPCRPAQRRETDSQQHSTGDVGRQMPVIGERERGELPLPLFSKGPQDPREGRKSIIESCKRPVGRKLSAGLFVSPGPGEWGEVARKRGSGAARIHQARTTFDGMPDHIGRIC